MRAMDDLGPDLYAFLVDRLYDMPPRDRQQAHWVMDSGWVAEIRKMTVAGRPIWEPSVWADAPDLLLGLPFEERDDGGVPHLVVNSALRDQARHGREVQSREHGDGRRQGQWHEQRDRRIAAEALERHRTRI